VIQQAVLSALRARYRRPQEGENRGRVGRGGFVVV
jgi:hypothetical protein